MAVALKEETKQIVGGLAQFVVVIALGAGVFCQLEGVSAVDGLYWAAITASTVGYGDVLAKTDEGMIFSCFFILVGCTIMANVISLPTDIYMGRQQRKKMEMVHGCGWVELSVGVVACARVRGCARGRVCVWGCVWCEGDSTLEVLARPVVVTGRAKSTKPTHLRPHTVCSARLNHRF